ncbi:hypothetical protein HMPREF1544_06864 [Mucor circinelloides 1006PhL]|uniref:sn-1-specific diacylglycerol lipase n=1 Tax=Mucor circinelloides f. circinelloides (strain 1006PhL) TaxID=1220926 RepID=S2K2B1_MUCC1|nr:hypothetical protein HMPREF1544_06864 [Mucor circinelloides 1006PhL]
MTAAIKEVPKLNRRNSPSLPPGTLRITINSCFLNSPVKRPYVTVTLGDQYHKTSISEYSQGSWNEGFELKVTYHNQLFDTIQLDLYDNNTFFLDKHIGRAEIRLKNLEGMPEIFTSYYEVLEKKLSLGATSQVSRKALMTSGVGAIQAEIAYHYRFTKEQASATVERAMSVDLSEMNWLIDQQKRALSSTSIDNIDTTHKDKNEDQELDEEFHKQLKSQRNNDDIKFKKFEQNKDNGEKEDAVEDYPDDSDSNDEDQANKDSYSSSNRGILTYSVSRANSTISTNTSTTLAMEETNAKPNSEAKGGILETVSSFFGYTTSSNINNPVNKEQPQPSQSSSLIDTEDDTLRSFPILDTIGSWTMAKETNQVFRAIGKLLVAFGQGFELSNLQILSGFNVVEKFYSDLPRERTWDLVEDVSEIEMASYMWRYAMASYGWKGLNFIGKGNGIFSDAVRPQSDALSIIEHLEIPKEDLLAYEFRTNAAFRPSYFIARDRKLNAIVLSIRGTMSTFDTMTDLVCEYEPWKGGLVHKGMKSSATWFFRHIAPKLIAYVNKHSTTSLYIVGHSLGASTSAILTIMLQDYISEFRQGKDGDFSIYSVGYAPACGLSLNLANKYKDQIQSIVFADDFVSKLSYGSMMDVKELIIAGAEAAKNIGFGQLIWAGELDNKAWKAAFERVAECRKKCLETMSNPRLYVAGTVYQFWLDPIPKNESRIVIERTTPEKVSTELILRMSILLDHLPTNFDVAFKRAMESFAKNDDAKDEENNVSLESGDNKTEPTADEQVYDSVAEAGLKGTTTRGGGEGNVLGGEHGR